MASYPRMLGQLTDPRRFPALTAFIAAGVFEAADGPDDEFIFGLDRILDGVGVLVGELDRSSPQRSACWAVYLGFRGARGRVLTTRPRGGG
jgi:hypothetical protein